MNDADKKFVEEKEGLLKYGHPTTIGDGLRLCRIIRELEAELRNNSRKWLMTYSRRLEKDNHFLTAERDRLKAEIESLRRPERDSEDFQEEYRSS